MKKQFLAITIISSTIFAGNAPSHQASDYYEQAAAELAAQAAAKQEAKIQAHAAAIAAQKTNEDRLKQKKRREQLQKLGHALGYGLRSAYLLTTGQTTNIKEVAAGTATIAATCITGYYSYKYWHTVKIFANPKYWLVGGFALFCLSHKINKK